MIGKDWMKGLLVAGAIVGLLGGCAASNTEKGALAGAAIGGVGGAMLGNSKTAAVGAAAGAVTGAIIGQQMDKNQ